MKIKKAGAILLCICIFFVSLCSGCHKEVNSDDSEVFKVGMVTDGGQIKADPFQFGAWEGIEEFRMDHSDTVSKYLESENEDFYLPNFDRLADAGYDLIWGCGFRLADSIKEAARLNPGIQYVLLDYGDEDTSSLKNLSYVVFQSEISAFLCGYIAGSVTETNKTGFIGGISSETIDRFEYGFRYGVDFAARERGVPISVDVEYLGTFEETLLGKNAALEMYENGCDVVFHAAGECGLGVIEAASLMNKWVIGADVDQYEEAPESVLTSAMKHIDAAVNTLTKDYYNKQGSGGKTCLFGLAEDSVGIPVKNPNLEEYYPGLYEKTIKLEAQIESGTLKIPTDRESYDRLVG